MIGALIDVVGVAAVGGAAFFSKNKTGDVAINEAGPELRQVDMAHNGLYNKKSVNVRKRKREAFL